MYLQKEAYPRQFQQATETEVLLFSSHIGFVLESELKNRNKFLGATIRMISTMWPPQSKRLFNSHLHQGAVTILTTHISLLCPPSWHVISCHIVRELHFSLIPQLLTAEMCLLLLPHVAHSVATSTELEVFNTGWNHTELNFKFFNIETCKFGINQIQSLVDLNIKQHKNASPGHARPCLTLFLFSSTSFGFVFKGTNWFGSSILIGVPLLTLEESSAFIH